MSQNWWMRQSGLCWKCRRLVVWGIWLSVSNVWPYFSFGMTGITGAKQEFCTIYLLFGEMMLVKRETVLNWKSGVYLVAACFKSVVQKSLTGSQATTSNSVKGAMGVWRWKATRSSRERWCIFSPTITYWLSGSMSIIKCLQQSLALNRFRKVQNKFGCV